MKRIKQFENHKPNDLSNGVSIELKTNPNKMLKFSLARISDEINIGKVDISENIEYDKMINDKLTVYSYRPSVLSYISNNYTKVDNIDVIYNKLNNLKTLYNDEIYRVYKTKFVE